MPDKNTLKTTLGGKIASFVDDASSLEVLTLSGSLKLVAPDGAANNVALKWDELAGAFAAQLTPANTNTLKVVAYTKTSWDADQVNYVTEAPTTEEQALIATHQTAVASAQKTRLEAVKAVADFVGGLF